MNPIFDLAGDFTWGWYDEFFVETSGGNFIWSDPDYNGNNTLRKVDFDIKSWCEKMGFPAGRCKGRHFLKDYCFDPKTGELAKLI